MAAARVLEIVVPKPYLENFGGVLGKHSVAVGIQGQSVVGKRMAALEPPFSLLLPLWLLCWNQAILFPC